ncbi:IclR family transcriptional regulator [Cupriavidus sp. 2TAF22]|uniref:IclR family transcriptional regulator n=1 Tax=unclassified Cupriavidus TaxID=2640874 RepID=UPI003F913E1F
MTTQMPDPTGVTVTVEHGLQVLRAFRADRAPLTNVELVRRTGLSKATVSRLTSTLIRVGFLRRVSGGREFELAPGSLSIGHAYLEANPVISVANPLMQDLADRLNVSVALAVPNHLDMLYIAYRSGIRIATLRLGVGSLLPMGSTSVGRAFLWALDDGARAGYISELLRSASGQRGMMEVKLAAAFEDLRSNGVCMSVGEYQRDAYGIALPVRVGTSRTLMTLSCGAVDVEPNIPAIRKRVIPALKTAAAALEVRLLAIDGES